MRGTAISMLQVAYRHRAHDGVVGDADENGINVSQHCQELPHEWALFHPACGMMTREARTKLK